MLKFLDVARLVGAGIVCPACNGTRCRQSNWRSKHERLGHIGYRPYRCDECEHRFFAASGASLERNLINGAAYVLLALALLTFVELWPEGGEAPATASAQPAVPLAAETGAAAPVAPAAPASLPLAAAASAQAATPKADPAGAGKAADEAQATNVKSLHKAASDGHPAAMIRLGQILAAGENHPRDPRQAAKWMQLAAATGSPQAMYELARYYRDGIGLAADPVRAYVWFSRAATARQADAALERDKLVRTMSEEKLNEAQVMAMSEP